MDANTFDRWTAALTPTPTRRHALRLLSGLGLVALLGHGEAEAKHKKKHKQKHHGAASPPPVSPPPSPPAASGPTCSDGIKNGSETGVDCGGPNCPRCEIGRTCAVNTDCGTSRCGDGLGSGNTCRSCAEDGVCGTDANGGCLCDSASGICRTNSSPPIVQSCDVCRPGEVCLSSFDGFFCFAPCGA
jgi:hypothetical protein